MIEHMFDALNAGTADRREAELVACEILINRIRHRQAKLIADADRDQTTLTDGCRTLAEWVAGRLDTDSGTAKRLVVLSRASDTSEGETYESFARTAATRHLEASGASAATIRQSRGMDIGTVQRLAGRHRRLTMEAERAGFASRYLTLQPSLDEAHWTLAGRLEGIDGAAVSKILDETADRFPCLPDGNREDVAARRADALVDHVTGHHVTGTAPDSDSQVSTAVTVFIDARQATETNGEAGAWIASGPRVGPATLERVLCDATIEVMAVTSDGQPLQVGTAQTTITPRTRRFVLFRDGDSCTADGCLSRHRVQPHHITPRAQGGDNHADNLASLCWYHHHVVVHRRGFVIDPTSPPGRRRFFHSERPGCDPPRDG